MRQEVLIDTGPIVAILSGKDHAHDACVEALRISKDLLTAGPFLGDSFIFGFMPVDPGALSVP